MPHTTAGTSATGSDASGDPRRDSNSRWFRGENQAGRADTVSPGPRGRPRRETEPEPRGSGGVCEHPSAASPGAGPRRLQPAPPRALHLHLASLQGELNFQRKWGSLGGRWSCGQAAPSMWPLPLSWAELQSSHVCPRPASPLTPGVGHGQRGHVTQITSPDALPSLPAFPFVKLRTVKVRPPTWSVLECGNFQGPVEDAQKRGALQVTEVSNRQAGFERNGPGCRTPSPRGVPLAVPGPAVPSD